MWNSPLLPTVSGGAQESQLLHTDQQWVFSTLSLESHSPPGEASCTQQLWAPQLILQSPSGHRPGPGSSPCRAQISALRKWGLTVTMLSEGSRQESPYIIWSFQSVQFSHLVMSNSLWPHGLQNARLPCSSPTPGALAQPKYLKGNLWSTGTKHICNMAQWLNAKPGLRTTQRRQVQHSPTFYFLSRFIEV